MDSGFDFESNENAFPNSIEDGDVLDDQFKADGLIDGDLGQGSLALDGDNDNEEDAEDELPGVDDLPLFAGPEARKIHLMIKDNEVQIEETDDKIVDLKDRIKVMKEHFKNVQQELEHTNSLQGAKLNEIRTEKHLKQLTSRALGGHKIEAKRIKTELERVQDALNDVQNQIFASNQKMDEFKLQMNWNQEELEQWSLAAKQKEEDFLALEKYKRADDFKVKELELKQEHLTKNLHLKRTSLDNEIAETDARQAELDRVSKDFDEYHKDRKEMLDRWQETIQELNKRDKAINDLGERFAVARTARIEKGKRVAIQQKRLDAQLYENNEVKMRSEQLSRIVSRQREEMMRMQQGIADFRDELESLKNELTSAAESLVVKRSLNINKKTDLEERRVVLERQRAKFQKSKAAVEDEKSSARVSETTAKEAEKALMESERDFNAKLLTIKGLKEDLLKEQQIVFDVKKEEASMRSTIHGNKAAAKNLENKLSQLDKDAARQQELLYNAEFQIQQIERKISRGMGERSDEEKRALRGTIEDLEAKVEKVKETRKMLQGQLRKLNNELVNTRNRKEAAIVRKQELTEKQAENTLQNRMLEDEIKADTKVKESQAVQNDLLRLEVRRLRDLLSAKADAVFSLENRRQQLLLSMEERKEEINVHRDMLKAELRVLEEEKHKVTMNLREKENNVERLRSRFAAQSSTAAEGEEHSQAYYVIQAAQKREELQRHGDELDHDIRKCEREIRALQTTLDHLNARNIAYRASFQKVDMQGSDAEVLKQMTDRTRTTKDMLFRKKKELQRVMTDFEEDQRRLEGLRQQHSRVDKQREHLTNAVQSLEDDLLNQQTTLAELGDRVNRVTLRHRENSAVEAGIDISALTGGTLEEKACRAEVTKDVVQNVLYTLGQLSLEFPEVSDLLNSRMAEAGLRMPNKPPTATARTRPTGNDSRGVTPITPSTAEYRETTPIEPRTFQLPVE